MAHVHIQIGIVLRVNVLQSHAHEVIHTDNLIGSAFRGGVYRLVTAAGQGRYQDDGQDHQDDGCGNGGDDNELLPALGSLLRFTAGTFGTALLRGLGAAVFRSPGGSVALRFRTGHGLTLLSLVRLLGFLRRRGSRCRRIHRGQEGQRRILSEFLHVGQHLRRSSVALLDIGIHGPHGDILQAQGDPRQHLAGAPRTAIDVLDGHGDRRLAVVGRAAREHLVHDHTQGIDVRAVIHPRTLGLLRGDVMDAAQGLPRQSILGGAHPCDAEIGDLDGAVLQNHDVVGLDVPVDDAPAVGVVQGLGDLHGKMQRLAPVEGTFLLQILLERDPLDQLHDDVVGLAGAGNVIDTDDIRVRQHGDRLGFRVEPAAELLVPRKFVLQYFHRDHTIEPVVQSLIDHGHSAGADHFQYLISTVQQSSYIIFHGNSLSATAARSRRRAGAELNFISLIMRSKPP